MNNTSIIDNTTSTTTTNFTSTNFVKEHAIWLTASGGTGGSSTASSGAITIPTTDLANIDMLKIISLDSEDRLWVEVPHENLDCPYCSHIMAISITYHHGYIGVCIPCQKTFVRMSRRDILAQSQAR